MLSVLVVGGGLLGALLGAIARATLGAKEWSNSKRISLLLAIMAAAACVGWLHSFPGQRSRLPQVACYLVSLITGYVVTAMLEGESRNEELPLGSPCRPLTDRTRRMAASRQQGL
jgi:hypothetical protein